MGSVDPIFMEGLSWSFKDMGGRRQRSPTPLGCAIRAPDCRDNAGQPWVGRSVFVGHSQAGRHCCS